MSEIANNLEQRANEFVMECKNYPDEEISKIVAGMVAIIEGNEATYERMKNQKWFERIWYGLTLQNKATVKEMHAKREELTKYTVRIIVKMNMILAEHGNCIFDLYRAVAIVRRDIDLLTDQVSALAQKLNEKIISVDQYYFLINEIRNRKFSVETPLLSLINILSFIDSRASKDKAKLVQLKETMEEMGFDFSKEVTVSHYAEEILSLPKESVGRILLFCQNFANRSRFMAFTCSLMENYFYQWESERHLSKANGEALSLALNSNNLHASDTCIIGELFDDITKELPNEFDIVDISFQEISTEIPARRFTRKSTKALNIIVTGTAGAGKTTLINSIFGWNCEVTGQVKQSVSKYSNDEDSLCLFETAGFYFDNVVNDEIFRSIEQLKHQHDNCVVWYCINSRGNRVDTPFIERIYGIKLPIVIVLTQSIIEDNLLENEIKQMIQSRNMSKVNCVSVVAKEYEKPAKVPVEGLEDLIDSTIGISSCDNSNIG
ncbi:GTPase domain-containing protein [Butyrivibrio sp. YAB3001]|uniref:GTPase domain-containing protein n=1 Tax=Butyrivibrio sp. YAB3001 TaxID=1520812 RepID=UPI0008F669AE|nr:GTPase domain-containing protein [Butyrivibrio sp. YAB3001]SFC55816.1 hypothetical protein SAMN02910398_02558 [Butyrivibrio sp. YAB3001]